MTEPFISYYGKEYYLRNLYSLLRAGCSLCNDVTYYDCNCTETDKTEPCLLEQDIETLEKRISDIAEGKSEISSDGTRLVENWNEILGVLNKKRTNKSTPVYRIIATNAEAYLNRYSRTMLKRDIDRFCLDDPRKNHNLALRNLFGMPETCYPCRFHDFTESVKYFDCHQLLISFDIFIGSPTDFAGWFSSSTEKATPIACACSIKIDKPLPRELVERQIYVNNFSSLMEGKLTDNIR